MKRKKIVRIAVILFALCMLTGYVVYSQIQQNRKVASGSKVRLLNEDLPLGSAKVTAPSPTPGSNIPAKAKFFPGSKSAQIFVVDPAGEKPPSAPSQPDGQKTAASTTPKERP